MTKHKLNGKGGPAKKVQKIPLNLAALPEEILLSITSFLDQHDTLQLLLSNKSFNKPCKIRLYKKILICEKYQDTFFNQSSQYQHFTLLSSWSNILKFFRFVYMSVKNNENLELIQYVEEISSFNYLDCGKLDPHRYLLKSDLQNILSFRQYWEIVLNTFVNLKHFNFPKIPIEKLYSLNSDIRLNLVEISVNLDDGFNNSDGTLKFKNLLLPNLKILKVNLETEQLSKSILEVIISILTNNRQSNVNHVLEELEVNGKFGKLDRDLEHSLRHHNWLSDVNLRSSFMKGFETAELMYKYNEPLESLYSKRLRRRGNLENGGNGAEEDDDDDDDDESFDEVYDNVHLDNALEEIEDQNDVEEKLNPILTDVQFTKDRFNGFHNKDTDFSKFSQLIIELAHAGVVLYNLKKFTLSNVTLNSNYHDLFRNSLKLLIPNSVGLKELHLRNVYSNINNELQELEENLIITYSKQNLSNVFNGELFDHLERLTFFSTPFIQTIPSHNTLKDFQVVELMNLQQILENSPKLESLKFFASNKIKLNDFYYILLDSNNSQNLKRLIYIKPIEILSICRKLLNVKIFKRFKNFNNLKIIDDYFFGISRQIIEFFNSVSRIDDYGYDDDLNFYKYLINDEKFLFNDEFNYLFKDDVKKFFIKFKSLQEFVYFGYTFQRKDMNL